MPSASVPPDPRRRAARHRNGDVSCPLGEVVEMSSCGIRIVCSGRPPVRRGDACTLRIGGLDGSVNVEARLVWMRRRGFRHFTLGFEFVGTGPALTRALESVALYGIFSDGEPAKARSAKCSPAGEHPAGAPPTGSRPKRAQAEVMLPDLYALLEVNPDATLEEINHAFRNLARHCHPDVSSDPASTQRFIRMRKAVAILRDSDMRRRYDERRSA